MQTQDSEKFVTAIAAMCSVFGKEADDATFEGFKIGLKDMPIEAIQRAVGEAIRTRKFMPTVAELRELGGEVTPQARAIVAWGVVSKASAGGYYESVDFDDPVINAAIRNLGGWLHLCSIEDSNEFESFVRAKFEKVYVALLAAGISAEQGAPLIGYYDQQNGLNGFEQKPPLRIETGLPAPRVRIAATQPVRKHLPAGEVKRIGEVMEPHL